MTQALPSDAEHAHFVGGTPFFASRHDQRLSYALYVPKDHTAQAAPLPLVVIQHGTGRSAELYRDRWKEFARAHRCIILTPLFPAGLGRPGELHNFKFLKYEDMRFDEELLHIVDEVGELFNARSERFVLHGFSGGGQFVHRFAYVHPGRLAGLSIGAPGRITRLDDSLPWWLGVADFKDHFGATIDLDALRRVPVQMVVGAEDTDTWEINNPGDSNWMDGVEKTGATRIERLRTLRDDFERQGIEVRFDLVPGVGHEGVGVAPAVQEFVADVLARRTTT
ncbi:hydrolase [Streptomyces sp. NRRL F-5126]|uniref:hydrolase n=1 Tax=Streptomyces sp. NRRL F-5126 TaxID=1463857 RepID=UPI0004C914E0|nr:hydrolase [Streptomyces sp. NRRL F-5126]